MHRPLTRRLAWTVPLSLGLHAVLLLALAGTWWSRPEPARSVTEVLLLDPVAPVPDDAQLEPEPEPEPPPRHVAAPAVSARAVHAPAPGKARAARPAPEPAPEPAAAADAIPAPGREHEPVSGTVEIEPTPDRDSPDVVLAQPGPRRIDLAPRLPGLLDPEAPREARAAIPQEADDWARERLDRYLRQLLGEDRVQSGAVSPGWSHIARRAERLWKPEFGHVQEPEITEVSGPWLAKLARDWWNDWTAGAARYGARGKAIPDEDDRRHDFGGFASLELNRAAYGGEGYGDLVTSVVEVRIAATGEAEVSLYRSSGYRTFDEQVVAAMSLALDAPDHSEFPEGPVRALYAMSAHYIILPPLPVVGFSFDLGLGYFDPMYPLKKIVHGNARLISVEQLPAEADAG